VPHSVYTGRAKSRTVRSPRRQCGTLCLRFTYEEGKAGRFTYPVSTPGLQFGHFHPTQVPAYYKVNKSNNIAILALS
jgi:hypothetical protein